MRVIVDAFGGDNAPLEILKGCAMAVQEYGVDIIACGSERVIRDVCEKNKISLDRISIADVEKVIPVEVDSTEIVKSYDDLSLIHIYSTYADKTNVATIKLLVPYK